MHQDENYYISRRPKLLKDFDKLLKPGRIVLKANFDDELASRIIADAREEFTTIIPELPYWGKNNLMTKYLIASACFLAIYRVLKEQEKPVDEIGKMIYDLIEAQLSRAPKPILWLYGKLEYVRHKRQMKKQAIISQQKQYPSDFVFTYIEGDGKEFDYGYDITECGICKFLHVQNTDELAPYICLVDFPLSKAFGSGLARTTTISEGAEKCDFRYKKGRDTKDGWPPSFLK